MFQTVNPATGQVVATYAWMNEKEIQSTLTSASESFSFWRKTALPQRAAVVKKLATAFRNEKQALAELMTLEMGKTLEEGLAEVEKCAEAFDYFSENAPDFLKPQEIPLSQANRAEVHLEPLGVILSIMPWNFPFWQFVRFAAPSLMVGNVIVLKHSTITAGCAQKIEELCRSVTERQLIFNLPMTHDQTAQVIHHSVVRGVTFTGSTSGGRKIAKVAGEALKKSVLELGGSDAYVIAADADLSLVAKKCASGRMINAGQSCIAAKRFIVVEEVFEDFVAGLKVEMQAYPVRLLAHEKFKVQLQQQVEKLKDFGGTVILGGIAEADGTAHYPPSILVFREDHPEIHKEELFGPVAMVIKAKDLPEAFRIANASPFGLGGGIFSKDVIAAKTLLTTEMEAGFVAVNDTIRSDPRLPFGGIKDSGFGRELSEHGFREFCNVKTVVVGA